MLSKKARHKSHISLYGSIYAENAQNRQIHRDRMYISGCQGLVRRQWEINAYGAGLYGMKKCSEIVFTSALHKWTKN